MRRIVGGKLRQSIPQRKRHGGTRCGGKRCDGIDAVRRALLAHHEKDSARAIGRDRKGLLSLVLYARGIDQWLWFVEAHQPSRRH